MNRKGLVALVLAWLLMSTTACAGSGTAPVNFEKEEVDSNQWVPVTSVVKKTEGSVAEIMITDMYKMDVGTDGEETDMEQAALYRQVYVKAGENGSPKLVEKGKWYTLVIPSEYRNAGDRVPLYAMGNSTWIDCCISGYWDVH